MIPAALALLLAVFQNDDSEIAAMYCQKGEAALKKNNADEALEHFEKALKRVPEHAPALDGLARAQLAKGRTDDAVDAWTRAKTALDAKPSLSIAERNLLDSVRDSLKKHDIAGPEFAKVAETLADLAAKWFGKKRYGAARRAAESALRLDPSNRSAKQTLEKLDAVEGAAAGGKDLLGGEEKWALAAGRDVKRGDDGGLVLGGSAETVSVTHPAPGSGDSSIFVSLRVDKLEPVAILGAGVGDALLLVLRQDKNGPTVEIHALEGREWKKKESAPLAVPLKEGAKFDLDIRLRGGAIAILVNQDGRRVGECGLAKGAPAEFKVGLYAQGATVTFTAVRLKTK